MTSPFDAAEHLGSDEAIAAFVDEALRSSDAEYILDALAVAIRAKGMNDIADRAGMARTDFYRNLKAGADVEFTGVVRLLRALGLRLTVRPVTEKPGRGATTKAASKKAR